MAFETVSIQSLRNGGGLTTGYREDLVSGDVLTFSLSSIVGISGVQWFLEGRPEGSSAGGAGPEPVSLGTGLTASFTVDSDSGSFRKDGGYEVWAVINPGSPGAVTKTVLVVRPTGRTIPGAGASVRTLRKLAAFESLNDDTSATAVLQGWATQLNRWLDYVLDIGSSGAGTSLAATYAEGTTAFDQTLVLLDAKGGGLVVDGSGGGFTGASALKVLTAAGTMVVDRATGNVGVGITSPLQSVHAKGTAPALRLDRTGGAALDIQNVGDELQFLNGATVMAKMEPTGGVRADLGVGIGTAPATAAVLALGAASTAPISSAGQARFRYNEVTNHAEWSENGGIYQPFATPTSAYVTIDVAGSPLPQRTVLDVAVPLTASDNSGASRTEISVATNGITGAFFRQSAALSLVGNSTNATANVVDVSTSSGSGLVLRESGGTLGFGTITATAITGLFYQTIDNGGSAVTQRPAWNASTGLTAVDNSGATRTDVTVNLSTGKSGGQTAFGGTGAGESLKLQGTTNATPGNVTVVVGTTAGQGLKLVRASDGLEAVEITTYLGGSGAPLGIILDGILAAPMLSTGTLVNNDYANNTLTLVAGFGGPVGSSGLIVSSAFGTGDATGYQVVIVPASTQLAQVFGVLNTSGGQALAMSPAGAATFSGPMTVSNLAGPGFVKASSVGLFTLDSTTYTPTTRTVQGTSPILIAGGTSAVDLSANRVWSLATNGVTYGFVQQATALSVLGRSANSTGNLADIVTTSGTGAVLRESGGVVGFGTITAAAVTGLFYQTVAEAGTNLTQRAILNFNGTVVAVDNSGSGRTDVGLPNVGPGATTTGSAGIASITTDAQGRIVSAATATYTVGGITALTGDVVATGPGSVTATIQPNVVSNAKFRQSGANMLVANPTGSTANVTDVGVIAPLFFSGGNLVIDYDGSSLVLSGGTVLIRAALTGDVTASAGLNSTTIAANAVTNAKFRQSAGLSVVGTSGNTLANVADITATGTGQVLQDLGATIGWAALAYSSLTGAPTIYYQTVSQAGTGLTQRPTLNFTADFSAVDNSGATRTDVSLGTSGVAAGTYITPTITVDAKGRVTSASFTNTYQTVESDGTPVAAEATLNFVAPLHAADSGGSPFRTNATLLYDSTTSFSLDGSNNLQLQNVGPGSGTIGSSTKYVGSVALDAKGRVTAATAVNLNTLATWSIALSSGSFLVTTTTSPGQSGGSWLGQGYVSANTGPALEWSVDGYGVGYGTTVGIQINMLTNTFNDTVVYTVSKNGTATAATVSITAGSTGVFGTRITLGWTLGDTFGIRMTSSNALISTSGPILVTGGIYLGIG